MKKNNIPYIQVHDRPYFNVHNKLPRGFGAWAFKVGEETLFVQPSMYFGAARRVAVKAAIEKNITLIEVLP